MGTKGETIVFCMCSFQLYDLMIINEVVQSNDISLKLYNVYEISDSRKNMQKVNRYYQRKIFENFSKFKILSDPLNGHVSSGLVNFFVYTNSRIQKCVEKDTQ